jgi:anti-repressor protein
MQEIIIQKQQINQRYVNTVNARDLYYKLQIQSKFADWIKNRLIDFEENIDFLTVSKNLENGGRSIEYHISIETAKHIAMIERNEQGKKIRQYFIDFENENTNLSINNLLRKQLALMIIGAEEEKERLEIEVNKKQEIINEYVTIDNNKTYTETAKILHLKPNKFIEKLRLLDYINNKNMPYQRYIDCNYFCIKKTVNKLNGLKHFESYLITPKGFDYFFKKVNTGIFDNIKI